MLVSSQGMLFKVSYFVQKIFEHELYVRSNFSLVVTVVRLNEVSKLKSFTIHDTHPFNLIIINVSIMEHADLKVFYRLVQFIQILLKYYLAFSLP